MTSDNAPIPANAQRPDTRYERALIDMLGAYRLPRPSRWYPGRCGTTPDGERFVYYGNHLRVGGSVAWRTHNPGHLYINAAMRAAGAIGRDGSLAVFPDIATGKAALRAMLADPTHGHTAVRQAVLKFGRLPQADLTTQRSLSRRLQLAGIDLDAPLRALRPVDMETLVHHLARPSHGGAGRIHLPGSPRNPAWAREVFATVAGFGTGAGTTGDGGGSGNGGGGTSASGNGGAGPARVLGDPDNWVQGTWYVEVDHDYVPSAEQDPRAFSDGLYARYDGNNGFSVYGIGSGVSAAEQLGQWMDAHPDDPNYYAVSTKTIVRDDGKLEVTTIEHFPPDVTVTYPKDVDPDDPRTTSTTYYRDGSTVIEYTQIRNADGSGTGGSGSGSEGQGGSGAGDPGGTGGNGNEGDPGGELPDGGEGAPDPDPETTE